MIWMARLHLLLLLWHIVIMISSSITASRIIIFGIGRIQNINPREGQFSFYSVWQKSRDRQQDFRIHDIDGGPVQSVDGWGPLSGHIHTTFYHCYYWWETFKHVFAQSTLLSMHPESRIHFPLTAGSFFFPSWIYLSRSSKTLSHQSACLCCIHLFINLSIPFKHHGGG